MATDTIRTSHVIDLVGGGYVVPISSGSYSTASISELSVQAAQSGNLVEVRIAVVRSSVDSTFRTIATGMPAPKLGSVNFPSGSNYYAPMGFAWQGGNARYLAIRVQSSGNLQIAGGGETGTFYGSFIYMTDSVR